MQPEVRGQPSSVLKEVPHEMVQRASFCDTSTLMSGGAAAWTVNRWGESSSRVETWRGGVGRAYQLSGSFVCRCLTSPTVLRFQVPLIEPDRRIARIRLSDKTSYVRPQLAMPLHAQLCQAQLLVQVLVGKSLVHPDPHPVFVA